MAFVQVKSMKDHKVLIEKYLKNREILKKRIIDEKTGKQHFQEDVAQLFKRPIKAELDKQQDELMKEKEKLQEGQKALATTQAAIVNAMSNLSPLVAIMGAPALPEALAEAATLIAIDAGLEPEVLKAYRLLLPSEIVKGDLFQIDPLQQYVSKELQLLGPSKKG